VTDKRRRRCARGLTAKYPLGLNLSDEGCQYCVLSEFRTRLVEGSLEQILLDRLLLDRLLERWLERGWR